MKIDVPNGQARFAVCVKNTEYPVSLELHKLYRVLPDDDAAKDGYLRVIDESGEDYLYSGDYFIVVEVPKALEAALLQHSSENAPPLVGIVNSWDEIPAFENEEQEAEFWGTHTLGPDIVEQLGPLPDGALPPPHCEVRVRIEAEAMRGLERLAAERGRGWQSLVREFVSDRVRHEEERAERDQQRSRR